MCHDADRVSIVADDLTGTLDTAQAFAARGHATSVIADHAAGVDGQTVTTTAIGVNTDSRYDDAARAADHVGKIVRSIPAEAVYKKVDSTLRGNIGAETDAALEASDAVVGLVAPAFPGAGRTTRDGRHYVAEVPVDETEYAADEKGPSTATVTALFDGIDRLVQHVPGSVLDGGPDSLLDRIDDVVYQSTRSPLLVCDARDEKDLATIARAGAERRTLYVGSGGLARYVHVLDPTPAKREPHTPASGAPLGVVGSVSETTLEQLAALPDESVIELAPDALLTETVPADSVGQVRDRLGRGQMAVVTAAMDRRAVERTLAAGRARGLSDREIRDRVSSGLAGTAAAAVRSERPSGLFFTGGDVAMAGLRALGATAVILSGESVARGIPIGHLDDGVAAGTRLITKAGGFGERDAIVKCLEALSGNNV